MTDKGGLFQRVNLMITMKCSHVKVLPGFIIVKHRLNCEGYADNVLTADRMKIAITSRKSNEVNWCKMMCSTNCWCKNNALKRNLPMWEMWKMST